MTAHQFLANVRTNLVFYRRNRVLVLVGMVVTLTLAISLITTAFTASKQFDLVHTLVSTIEGFCFIFSAFLGLMSISHHVRTRSVKLVLTKPFSLGAWVLSHFASALIVIVVAHLLALLGAIVLFAVWDLPFQWGLIADLVQSVFACVIVFAFLLFLSTVVHPVVAAVIALVFNPPSVQNMLTMLEVPRRFAEGGVSRFLYDALAYLLTGIYYLLPEYVPFSADLSRMFSTYRVTWFDLPYLILTTLYTPIVTALCLLLTIDVLSRKRLI